MNFNSVEKNRISEMSPLSQEEIRSIRECIYFHEEDIVVWKETQQLSEFTIDVSFEKLKELTNQLDKFYLIVDLCDSRRPNMQYVNKLKIGMNDMTDRGMLGIFIFFGNYVMFNSIVKYVTARIGIPVLSVNKNLEDALSAIQKRKLEAG